MTIYRHSGVIPFIPWSFEHWNDAKWHYVGMTGMMQEWRFRSFWVHSFHSCHPRLLGKMGAFLISSQSSGLIPSFGCHSKMPNWWGIASNDVGMTDDFGLKWTTFPIWKVVYFISFILILEWRNDVGMIKMGHSWVIPKEICQDGRIFSLVIPKSFSHSAVILIRMIIEWRKKSFYRHSCNLT